MQEKSYSTPRRHRSRSRSYTPQGLERSSTPIKKFTPTRLSPPSQDKSGTPTSLSYTSYHRKRTPSETSSFHSQSITPTHSSTSRHRSITPTHFSSNRHRSRTPITSSEYSCSPVNRSQKYQHRNTSSTHRSSPSRHRSKTTTHTDMSYQSPPSNNMSSTKKSNGKLHDSKCQVFVNNILYTY